MLYGQRISTDSVVADLKAAKAALELACFLAHCCKNKKSKKRKQKKDSHFFPVEKFMDVLLNLFFPGRGNYGHPA